MNDIIKIVKFLIESGLLIKGLGKRSKMEQKKKGGGFRGMLLGRLGASLLGNLLTGKEIKAKIPEAGVMRAGEGATRADRRTIRTGQDF